MGPDELTTLSVLADPRALRILHLLVDSPRTAAEIVRLTKFPPAACYRRLNALVEHGFVEAVGAVLTRKGKPAKKFRSNVAGVRVVYEGGRLFVNLSMREGGTREFVVTLPEENAKASP